MNAQKFLNYGCQGIVDQGGPSFRNNADEDGGILCLYRKYEGEKVLKCFAGQHLTDEEYDSSMEKTLSHNLRLPADHPLKIHSSLAHEAQIAHDTAAKNTEEEPDKFFSVFKQDIEDICDVHNLQLPECLKDFE